MKIRPFGVEMWMNAYENNCTYNLAETCVDSITIDELLALADLPPSTLDEIRSMRLSYGAIEGSDRLRSAVAALYNDQSAENVVITHGAIGANALVYSTLISGGDHVVSILPTYQQHYSIPESYGATVDVLHLSEDEAFLPDLDALASMVTPQTVLIALTNPNNPTGSVIDRAGLERLVEIARANDAWVLCDEVYRGIGQDGDAPPVVDMYDKGISVGSMSKAFSLAGLRLGWIAAKPSLLEDINHHRDYTTISVGMIDDFFASIALENADAILDRNRQLTQTNLAILDEWVGAEAEVSYVKPSGGTTALLKFETELSSRDFCLELLDKTGVMMLPGSALDMEGYVRIGFANATDILSNGLAETSKFLASATGEVPAEGGDR